MADFDTIAPIDDAEILYRRIPLSTGWYQPDKQPPLEPEAFRPTRFDSSGISVSRRRYTSLELAARGQPGKVYYVAVFGTCDLRAAGMEVTANPVEGNPGHAEISSLRYDMDAHNLKTPLLVPRIQFAGAWYELTKHFGRLFSTEAGRPNVIDSTRSQNCLLRRR